MFFPMLIVKIEHRDFLLGIYGKERANIRIYMFIVYDKSL